MLAAARAGAYFTCGAQRHAGNALHGEYQIAKSKEGAETLRVTIAGRFTAAPGDIAAVSETKVGIVGNFRVIECVSALARAERRTK